MGKVCWFTALATVLLVAAAAAALTQNAPTSPANETRHPAPVRSPYSHAADLMAPLCPVHFHDSLRANGIAGPHDAGVTPPKAIKEVPAKITQDAVRTAGKTHIGNYHVIVNIVVNKKGDPTQLCLEKSAGYGLDASAAAAVEQYRFHPATKDGKPEPMRMAVEVPFVTPNPPEAPRSIPAQPTQ